MSWDYLPDELKGRTGTSENQRLKEIQSRVAGDLPKKADPVSFPGPNTLRSIKGLQRRIAGDNFENIIAASLEWYKIKGWAEIEKTPEPMKPLSRPNKKGQFLACFTKAAQPDFKGTLLGGRSVVFEAKHTDSDQIKYSAVTKDQHDRLERHYNLGAVAFVLVSLGLQDFYRVPWKVWRDMKAIYGYKHMKRADLEPYRVQYIAGVLKLLEGVELKHNPKKEE